MRAERKMNFKKIAIFGAVFAAILAAVLGFLFYTSSSTDYVEDKSGAVIIPTVHPSKIEKLTSFSESNVSFEYPEEATVEIGVVDGGGEAILISPDISVNPVIEIQITSASNTPIEQIHNIFSGYGFQKENVLMGEGNTISATLYTGAISLLNGDLQEEVVVFEENGKVYKIQMSYTSEVVSTQASEAFQAVISTFKI